jgi:cell division protein FtsW (lipid II flippase)
LNKLNQIILKVLTTRVAWPIVFTITLLCSVSILSLRLSSQARADRQEIHILLGALALLLCLFPHFQTIGRAAYNLYALALLLLIAVLFAPAIAYTHRWFVIPATSIQIQPSEFAKIAFVISAAWYLRNRKNIRTVEGLIIPFLLALIPFALILVEPDLGTAALFPLVLYAMLIAAGARFRHLIIIAVILPLLGWGAFPFLKDYQKERIYSIARVVIGHDDPAHHTGSSFQQLHSMMAIGAGGATGQGEQGAKLITPETLPEAYTDFIFALIGIQWGFAGCALILILYLAFFGASVEIAASTRDNFGRLLVVGLTSIILFQALINIAMTIALAPVVGIELPFLSYGGSSLISSFIAAGLLLNVSIRRGTRTAHSG